MWPCCRSGCRGGGGDYILLTEEDPSTQETHSPSSVVAVRSEVPSPIPPRTAHGLLEIGFDIIRSGTNLVLFCLRRPSVTARASRVVAASLATPTSSTAMVPSGDTDLWHATLYMVQGAGHVGLLLIDPTCRRRRWRLIRAGLSATAVAHALLEIIENDRLLRAHSEGMLPEVRMQRMTLMFSDIVFLVYEGYYFMGEAVRCAHNRVRRLADRRDGILQQSGQMLLRVHRAFHRRIRQTANLVGAAGLTLAATLSTTATIQALSVEGSDHGIEAAVLATQSAVMMAAAAVFGWMFARGVDRSRQ